MEIEEKEQLSLDPTFWSDPQRAESILKELKSHKKWVAQYDEIATVIDDVEGLYEFFREDLVSEEELDAKYAEAKTIVENVEFHSTLNQPEDELSVTLEINAGAGGTEACDWAEMLLRMYTMWGDRNGFKVTEINRQDGEVAGIKSAEIEIEGDFVYGLLKGENGVHRLVRVSPYNSQGKRMTSFASVFVHPVVDDRIEIDINPADLRIDVFRASGAGGQHVNKTESAVRITHLPSNIVVQCQNDRSQHRNRDEAMNMLRARLFELEMRKRRAEQDKVEASKTDIGWGHQIRSYVLDQSRIKDLRTNYETSNTKIVLDGDLDAFIQASLKMGV